METWIKGRALVMMGNRYLVLKAQDRTSRNKLKIDSSRFDENRKKWLTNKVVSCIRQILKTCEASTIETSKKGKKGKKKKS